ncbi:DUF3368 domain-containing protein [Candidatus Magnetomoraceae bacterium gMMP-13]
MIISNTTPLINFSAIHRLDILQSLFEKIYIPSAVKVELFEKGKYYPSTTELKNVQFIETMSIHNTMHRDALLTELDIGEAEAITLALEKKAEFLLLDEVTGRMMAESYNIPIIGSIGCLVEAKRCNMIPSIKQLLDDMKYQAKFWVNPKLYEKILKDNNEY